MKILLIEDDIEMLQTVRGILQHLYVVETATTGAEAIRLIEENEYDLIILDLVLPDIPGDSVCSAVRKNDIGTPILMLTGQGETSQKVRALDAGADDYLTKPFVTEELLARIRALLRRPPATDKQKSSILIVSDLELDTVGKTVSRAGKRIILRRKEFDLLEYMMRNAGQILTRVMILNHLWDSSYDMQTNTVDVHIKYLRDRIDKGFNNLLIKTVYGVGYKLEDPERR